MFSKIYNVYMCAGAVDITFFCTFDIDACAILSIYPWSVRTHKKKVLIFVLQEPSALHKLQAYLFLYHIACAHRS